MKNRRFWIGIFILLTAVFVRVSTRSNPVYADMETLNRATIYGTLDSSDSTWAVPDFAANFRWGETAPRCTSNLDFRTHYDAYRLSIPETREYTISLKDPDGSWRDWKGMIAVFPFRPQAACVEDNLSCSEILDHGWNFIKTTIPAGEYIIIVSKREISGPEYQPVDYRLEWDSLAQIEQLNDPSCGSPSMRVEMNLECETRRFQRPYEVNDGYRCNAGSYFYDYIQFTVPFASRWHFDTCGASVGTVLALYTSVTGPFDPNECSSPLQIVGAGSGSKSIRCGQPSINWELQPDITYTLVVTTQNAGDRGAVNLNVATENAVLVHYGVPILAEIPMARPDCPGGNPFGFECSSELDEGDGVIHDPSGGVSFYEVVDVFIESAAYEWYFEVEGPSQPQISLYHPVFIPHYPELNESVLAVGEYGQTGARNWIKVHRPTGNYKLLIRSSPGSSGEYTLRIGGNPDNMQQFNCETLGQVSNTAEELILVHGFDGSVKEHPWSVEGDGIDCNGDYFEGIIEDFESWGMDPLKMHTIGYYDNNDSAATNGCDWKIAAQNGPGAPNPPENGAGDHNRSILNVAHGVANSVASNGKTVNAIGHSMGGLVLRSSIALGDVAAAGREVNVPGTRDFGNGSIVYTANICRKRDDTWHTSRRNSGWKFLQCGESWGTNR